MFSSKTYQERRRKLKEQIQSGVILFLGNQESPMNYPDNAYSFRQDSSFLYFWGLDFPGLAATIDVEANKEVIYGDDLTVEQIVWMGPQPTLREKSEKVGVATTAPFERLQAELEKATQGERKIHFLPQYRADNKIYLGNAIGVNTAELNDHVSDEFLRAVIAQRSTKSEEEIREIESALEITYEMHTLAMRESKPGRVEREIAGAMQGLALSRGGELAYPIIFSIHGETLHNHYHGNVMKAGDIIVNDSGAESALHYASDITRTIPVSGTFTEQQKSIYQMVDESLENAMKAVRPGTKFKDIHLLASKHLATGLKDLGLMKGDVGEAVEAGAHALFFQCGVGHMMGLDVHDMEDLGEDLVGYDEETLRSEQFGLRSLRLGKRLQPGSVVTVEPGIYFIPQLIDQWKAENKLEQYFNYAAVEKYKSFGGIRLEENLVVTQNGHRVLGRPIPRAIDDVEELASR